MIQVAIGYDSTIPKLSYTCAESILDHASQPVKIIFLNKNTLPQDLWWRPRGEYDSTEFSNSRFLTPYLFEYQGKSLYLDNDMIVCHDVAELFDTTDYYMVSVVKHNQVVTNTTKFGQKQTKYDCKNWSSVMLFNNKACSQLSPLYVNEAPGLHLHQFHWVRDRHRIGSLPLEWNYLVDNENQTEYTPKLIHYTNGGPYYEDTRDCEHADVWKDVANKLDME